MHDRHDHEDATIVHRPLAVSYASIEVDPDIYIPARAARRGIFARWFHRTSGLSRRAA